MPFVTTLTFESGNRHLLDDVVEEIKDDAERKGVALKGPFPRPHEDIRVPQSKQLTAEGDAFEAWNYTVYSRDIKIVGYDDFARSIAEREFPDAISVEAEIDQQHGLGRGN